MLRHPCSMFIEDQYFEQIPHKVNKGSFQASCCNCLCKSFYIFHLFKTLWQNSQVLGPKKETPYVPWYPRFTDGVSNWGRYLKLPKKMPDSIRVFSDPHFPVYGKKTGQRKSIFWHIIRSVWDQPEASFQWVSLKQVWLLKRFNGLMWIIFWKKVNKTENELLFHFESFKIHMPLSVLTK